MMIRALTVATTLAALVMAVSPASAQLDRTDLADGTWATFSTSTGAGPSTFARGRGGSVAVDNLVPGNYAFNYFRGLVVAYGNTMGVGAPSNAGGGFVALLLYEPEKVGRKSDQVKLQQKTAVAAIAFGGASGSVTTSVGISAVIDNCSIKAQGKGTAGGAANKAQVKIKCPDILGGGGLNLNAAQASVLARILGLAAINDKELSVKSTTATFTP